MSLERPKVQILYGSQTGNAQDIAEQLWRETKKFHFVGSVFAMDDYNILNLIYEKIVIFICSTTGQGEEPDNMKKFWNFMLRKSLSHDSLTGLKFAVLGLGDSSYIKFNFSAKRLQKRLLQLGAQELLPLGLADDQHEIGYDGVAVPWIESLWFRLLQLYPLPTGVLPLKASPLIVPRWKVSSLDESNIILVRRSIYSSNKLPTEFYVTLKENTRVTHYQHFQDVRLIKFKTNGEEYNPGDVLVLRPKNLSHQIEAFLDILKNTKVNFCQKTVLKLANVNGGMPVPLSLSNDVTFQELCEEYFDLSAIPRKHFFNILAQLTGSDLEKEKCLEFASSEGQNDLYNYCNRPRRNVVEVLADFPHAAKNITIELLFELLPPIKPRDFSIASSYKYHKNEVHILVAVVKYSTKLIKERLGLCSNYLANIPENEQLLARIKKGSFRFPNDKEAPVIMVGPGTGVAPFRSYIHERVKEENATSKNLTLFFGCRNRDKDFYCKEIIPLHEEGKINLIFAFSRDQEYKVYVQHKIVENSGIVWKALESRRGYIFVAGNSKFMPQEVREAFIKVGMLEGKLSKDEAEKMIVDMEKCNRYQTETWS